MTDNRISDAQGMAPEQIKFTEEDREIRLKAPSKAKVIES